MLVSFRINYRNIGIQKHAKPCHGYVAALFGIVNTLKVFQILILLPEEFAAQFFSLDLFIVNNTCTPFQSLYKVRFKQIPVSYYSFGHLILYLRLCNLHQGHLNKALLLNRSTSVVTHYLIQD